MVDILATCLISPPCFSPFCFWEEQSILEKHSVAGRGPNKAFMSTQRTTVGVIALTAKVITIIHVNAE